MFSYVSVLTNLFALAVLLVIAGNFFREERHAPLGPKLFGVLLALNAVMLIADCLQFFPAGPSGLVRNLREAAAVLVCGLPVLICFFWTLFVRCQVRQDFSTALRAAALLLVPTAAVAFLAFFSGFNGLFFTMDAQSAARHGTYFWIYAAACAVLLAWAQVIMLQNRERLRRRFSASLFLCVLPPVLGAVLHPIFPGPSPAWPFMTFSLLLLFLDFQRGQLHTDHLTGLYNRWHLDTYLREWASDKKRHTMLAGIMTDLDSFKNINDRYGHITGDRALVDAGSILRASVRSSDFVCRYGGDEFIVMVEVRDRSELERVVTRIRANVERYNGENRMPFQMSLSLGYDVFDPGTGMTTRQFLRHIDQLMYRNKMSRKQQRRNVIQAHDDPGPGRQAPQ